MYFDGCAMIVLNGKLLAQGDQFSLRDVQVRESSALSLNLKGGDGHSVPGGDQELCWGQLQSRNSGG